MSPESGPWATLDFLLAPDERLDGVSPLETLRRGGNMAEVDRLLRTELGDGFAQSA